MMPSSFPQNEDWLQLIYVGGAEHAVSTFYARLALVFT